MYPFDENSPKPKGAACAGFTLVEVLVATALLGLLAGSAIWALAQANNYASIARLYTGAETAAQNQIDLILTMVLSTRKIIRRKFLLR
jgi:prepilin-type N-terminal cleavage/methylation domain-containing protein